jgi:hypothetical protein
MVHSKNLFINRQRNLRFGLRRGDVRSLSECVGPLAPTVKYTKTELICRFRGGGQLSAPTVRFATNGLLNKISETNESKFVMKGGV